MYFVFGLTWEGTNDQSGDVLPRYTKQRSLVEIEEESQEIIEHELSRDAPSYETIRSYEPPFSGFLHYYLKYTKNDETLTTTTKSDVVKTLGENDLLRSF